MTLHLEGCFGKQENLRTSETGKFTVTCQPRNIKNAISYHVKVTVADFDD